jgi:hypothetical protein
MTSKVVLFSMFLSVAFMALLAPSNAGGKVNAVKGTAADVHEEKSGLVLAVQHLLGPKLIEKLGEGYDKVNKNVYNFFLGYFLQLKNSSKNNFSTTNTIEIIFGTFRFRLII